MKHYDDESLERALFALPLEEPPADMHAAILAATIYRPVLFKPWEMWLIGAVAALLAWLVGWIVVDGATAGQTIRGVGTALLAFFGSTATLYWIALGGAVAVWFSQLNFIPIKRSERR